MARLGKHSVVGTQFKVNLYMTPIGDSNLENSNFDIEVFTKENSSNIITISKNKCKKIDSNNYLIPIDSSELGAGRYYIRLIIHLKDSEFEGGIRIEKKTAYTNVIIDEE